MKLKVNTRILFVLILLTALAMNSCRPKVHIEATTIPTVAIIIVDTKGAPVNQSGITVTDNYGTGNILNYQTNSSGVATFHIGDPIFPMTFSATDGGHHTFSHITIESFHSNPDTIKLTESTVDTTAVTNVK